MGHDKLRKFAENETFSCLLQPSSRELLSDGFFNLKDHAVKGNWGKMMFPSCPDNPIVLELGCGKGEYTIGLARKDAALNCIGVDIKGARLWKGAKTATLEGIPNVAFLRSRIELITAFFAPSEVSEVWLTFSDPQFRSENSRLCSPVFLERYRKFLRPGGVVHLKTDSRFLFEYARAVCAENSLKVIACTEDLYGSGADADGIPAIAREVRTFYEGIFLEQGYKICYMSFTLDGDAPLVRPGSFDAEYWRSVEGPRQLFGRDTAETRRRKLENIDKQACHAESEE